MKFARSMPQTPTPTIVGGACRMRMASLVQRLDVRPSAGGRR